MKEIDYKELNFNPMTMIGKNWVLITAGDEATGYNTMTASWGHIGAIWGHSDPTAVVYIRPQRYTKQFVDRADCFTISVLNSEKYRKELAWLGTYSGRDYDKFRETGLTPLFTDGTTAVAESDIVFVCRKLYQAPLLEENFIDKSIVEEDYSKRDFHDMYIAKIEKVLVKE